MTKDKLLNLLHRTGQALCFLYILGLAGMSDATAVPFAQLSVKAICAGAVLILLSILNKRKEDAGA